jgi:hypothetical protein
VLHNPQAAAGVDGQSARIQQRVGIPGAGPSGTAVSTRNRRSDHGPTTGLAQRAAELTVGLEHGNIVSLAAVADINGPVRPDRCRLRIVQRLRNEGRKLAVGQMELLHRGTRDDQQRVVSRGRQPGRRRHGQTTEDLSLPGVVFGHLVGSSVGHVQFAGLAGQTGAARLFALIRFGPQLAAEKVDLPSVHDVIRPDLLLGAEVDEPPLAVGGQVTAADALTPLFPACGVQADQSHAGLRAIPDQQGPLAGKTDVCRQAPVAAPGPFSVGRVVAGYTRVADRQRIASL